MPDVSIIIISYNTREMTLDCIRSVYDQTREISFEIIVVDNDSDDGSAEAIEENFPDIILVKSDQNLGFARANNLAVKQASGRYVLLLNPDTVVLSCAIDSIYKFAVSSPDNLIYGGKTLHKDMTLNPTSCWRQQSLWSLFCYSLGFTSLFRGSRIFDPESYGEWKRDTVREVGVVTGCFLLIEKSFWDLLGGFSPDFFMYAEDADLCLRAIENGAKPVITPDAVIIHYGGASEKVRADKMIRLFKAKELLMHRHWSSFKAQIGRAMLGLGVFARALATKLLKCVSPKRFNESATNWQEIWNRRKEWHNL